MRGTWLTRVLLLSAVVHLGTTAAHAQLVEAVKQGDKALEKTRGWAEGFLPDKKNP